MYCPLSPKGGCRSPTIDSDPYFRIETNFVISPEGEYNFSLEQLYAVKEQLYIPISLYLSPLNYTLQHEYLTTNNGLTERLVFRVIDLKTGQKIAEHELDPTIIRYLQDWVFNVTNNTPYQRVLASTYNPPTGLLGNDLIPIFKYLLHSQDSPLNNSDVFLYQVEFSEHPGQELRIQHTNDYCNQSILDLQDKILDFIVQIYDQGLINLQLWPVNNQDKNKFCIQWGLNWDEISQTAICNEIHWQNIDKQHFQRSKLLQRILDGPLEYYWQSWSILNTYLATVAALILDWPDKFQPTYVGEGSTTVYLGWPLKIIRTWNIQTLSIVYQQMKLNWQASRCWELTTIKYLLDIPSTKMDSGVVLTNILNPTFDALYLNWQVLNNNERDYLLLAKSKDLADLRNIECWLNNFLTISGYTQGSYKTIDHNVTYWRVKLYQWNGTPVPNNVYATLPPDCTFLYNYPVSHVDPRWLLTGTRAYDQWGDLFFYWSQQENILPTELDIIPDQYINTIKGIYSTSDFKYLRIDDTSPNPMTELQTMCLINNFPLIKIQNYYFWPKSDTVEIADQWYQLTQGLLVPWICTNWIWQISTDWSAILKIKYLSMAYNLPNVNVSINGDLILWAANRDEAQMLLLKINLALKMTPLDTIMFSTINNNKLSALEIKYNGQIYWVYNQYRQNVYKESHTIEFDLDVPLKLQIIDNELIRATSIAMDEPTDIYFGPLPEISSCIYTKLNQELQKIISKNIFLAKNYIKYKQLFLANIKSNQFRQLIRHLIESVCLNIKE